MKRCALLLMLLLLLPLCGMTEGSGFRVMVASDLHYLSPSLYEGSDLFLRVIGRSDGKAAMYSGELLQGLVNEAMHQQPDLLILTGDLTYNGEKKSHEELAAAMRGLAENGVPVIVIPGNHDINSPNALRFLYQAYEYTDAVTPDQFRSIWQGMLPETQPGPGISGVAELNDHVWLMLGDYSVYEQGVASFGLATKGHFDWLETVAQAARANGVTLISASHQGLLPHTSFAAETFSVYDGPRVVAMLADAGCRVNLSGHMHLQHILRDERITDIATGAWSVSPHRYGMVSISPDGQIIYDACTVCGEHLPDDLADTTRSFFRKVTMDKQRESLTALGIHADIVEEMLSFAADVNEYYFAGTVSEHMDLMEQPGSEHWQKEGESIGFGSYLATILKENAADACHWSTEE